GDLPGSRGRGEVAGGGKGPPPPRLPPPPRRRALPPLRRAVSPPAVGRDRREAALSLHLQAHPLLGPARHGTRTLMSRPLRRRRAIRPLSPRRRPDLRRLA